MQGHEELLKIAQAANKEDREDATLFEVMIKTPAWQAYVKRLQRRMQTEGDAILGPAQSVDGMVALEYRKGALSGLVIARDLPSVTIQAAKELRQPEGNSDASA